MSTRTALCWGGVRPLAAWDSRGLRSTAILTLLNGASFVPHYVKGWSAQVHLTAAPHVEAHVLWRIPPLTGTCDKAACTCPFVIVPTTSTEGTKPPLPGQLASAQRELLHPSPACRPCLLLQNDILPAAACRCHRHPVRAGIPRPGPLTTAAKACRGCHSVHSAP